MTDKAKTANKGLLIGGVVVALSLFLMALLHFSFDGPRMGATWPLLFVGIGVILALNDMMEMGIFLGSLFGLWFFHNLGYLSFRRTWPFVILIVAVLFVVGYLRSKSKKQEG